MIKIALSVNSIGGITVNITPLGTALLMGASLICLSRAIIRSIKKEC